jgi:hypothetical protein
MLQGRVSDTCVWVVVAPEGTVVAGSLEKQSVERLAGASAAPIKPAPAGQLFARGSLGDRLQVMEVAQSQT